MTFPLRKRSGGSKVHIANVTGLQSFAGSNPVSSAISWRPILFVSLLWLFIYAGPYWYESVTTHPQVCNPLVLVTCEP